MKTILASLMIGALAVAPVHAALFGPASTTGTVVGASTGPRHDNHGPQPGGDGHHGDRHGGPDRGYHHDPHPGNHGYYARGYYYGGPRYFGPRYYYSGPSVRVVYAPPAYTYYSSPVYYASAPTYYAATTPSYSSTNYAATGTLLGGIAGAIIGNNSGSLHHNGWAGAAIGAGAGLILGSVLDSAAAREERAESIPVYSNNAVQTAPAQPVQQPQQPTTIINNYYNTPASAMTPANSLYGR